MDERSDDVYISSRVKSETEEVVEDEPVVKKRESYNPPKRKTIKLQLMKDKILRVAGKATGKVYVFSGAGAIVDVDEEDARIMMDRKQPSCCPGSIGSTPYFQIIE